MEIIPIILVVLAAAAIPAAIAFSALKNKRKLWLFLTIGLWTAFTGFMFFEMEAAQGWDELGYFLGLLFISAPAALGMTVGSVAGLIKGNGDGNAAT